MQTMQKAKYSQGAQRLPEIGVRRSAGLQGCGKAHAKEGQAINEENQCSG